MSPPKLIALLGKAGSGKDTVGKMITELVKGARTIALADPLKRYCKEVFDFTDEQLWGPSEMRNAPDKRYVHRRKGQLGTTEDVYLTPRYALQRLGTEWGRDCYSDIWIDLGIRTAKRMLEEYQNNRALEEASLGAIRAASSSEASLVVLTDCRFLNEAKAVRAAGGEVWRIVRPNADAKAVAAAGVAGHASEAEQDAPEMEQYVSLTINNDGTLQQLRDMTEVLLFKR